MSAIAVVVLAALLATSLVAAILFRIVRKRPPLPVREPGGSIASKEPDVSEIAAPSDEVRVARGLSRSKEFFQSTLDRLFAGNEAGRFFGELEEALLVADIGIELSEKLASELKSMFGLSLPSRAQLKEKLGELLLNRLPQGGGRWLSRDLPSRPYVIMVVGVNGAGKTTTIAKLCQRFRSEGRTVLVGGCDTFRAAAVEQLRVWVERTGAEAVFQKEGADPTAVAFDSVQAAVSRAVDVCILDTAGRLHTKSNLMEELKKMKRVLSKAQVGAPHETWLVIDGSTGQNALLQAKEFHSALGLTGLIVTKLDGTAKGGAVLAISSELGIPVRFIGVGETPEDLVVFDSSHFVSAILGDL